MALLEVDGVGVTYPSATGPVTALAPLSWTADRGEVVMVSGPSGSGKTTLLSCVGGILQPTTGSVVVDGLSLGTLDAKEMCRYRREKVGIVFQDFNLIPSLTAVENVSVPMWAAGRSHRDARVRATELLERLGLGERIGHRPGQLSGGQQQRVAIARALALDPPVLIADEPTANLDVASAEAVIGLLRGELTADRVVVLATHDLRLRAVADQMVDLVPRIDAEVDTHSVALAAGEVLFHEGDASDAVYRVEAGQIDLLRRAPGGGAQVLRRCEAGSYFGETGPLLGFVRSATARAATDATVVAMSLAEFRREAGASAAGPSATPEPATPEPATPVRRRRRPLVAGER